MFSHVMLGSHDVAAARDFYEAVLRPLGLHCIVDSKDFVAFATAEDDSPRFGSAGPMTENRPLSATAPMWLSLPLRARRSTVFIASPWKPAAATRGPRARAPSTARPITAPTFVIWTAIRFKPFVTPRNRCPLPNVNP